jgi:hypothetical protein
VPLEFSWGDIEAVRPPWDSSASTIMARTAHHGDVLIPTGGRAAAMSALLHEVVGWRNGAGIAAGIPPVSV